MIFYTSLGSLFFDPTEYRQIVGALLYVTFTRLDLAFSINKVCQFMHQLTDAHWLAVKCILQYLCGTHTHGLYLRRKSPFFLEGFCNTN